MQGFCILKCIWFENSYFEISHALLLLEHYFQRKATLHNAYVKIFQQIKKIRTELEVHSEKGGIITAGL